VAGLGSVEIFDVSTLESISLVQAVAIAPGTCRAWLLDSAQGAIVVGLRAPSELSVRGLWPGAPSTKSFELPFAIDAISFSCFCQVDAITDVLCFGSFNTDQVMFIKLGSLNQPVAAVGEWKNGKGVLSVCCSSHLHGVFGEDDGAMVSSMYVYAYHADSVQMHHFRLESVNHNDNNSATFGNESKDASRSEDPSFSKVDAAKATLSTASHSSDDSRNIATTQSLSKNFSPENSSQVLEKRLPEIISEQFSKVRTAISNDVRQVLHYESITFVYC
jgi:hypothetical protein